jgi:hypothetical protein
VPKPQPASTAVPTVHPGAHPVRGPHQPWLRYAPRAR